MKLYVCPICGNVIELLEGDINHITCCGREMELLEANISDASAEKHIPVYNVNNDVIEVTVGKAQHPMEEEHYITWITLKTDKKLIKKCLKWDEMPKAQFPYIKNSEIYAYCNKHGLWMTKVN